jgi:hypothetical protein
LARRRAGGQRAAAAITTNSSSDWAGSGRGGLTILPTEQEVINEWCQSGVPCTCSTCSTCRAVESTSASPSGQRPMDAVSGFKCAFYYCYSFLAIIMMAGWGAGGGNSSSGGALDSTICSSCPRSCGRVYPILPEIHATSTKIRYLLSLLPSWRSTFPPSVSSPRHLAKCQLAIAMHCLAPFSVTCPRETG